MIPLGQAVTLITDPKTDEFTWQANVASGTSMVFIITDSLGRGGGTSDVGTVSESSNAACLNEQSPHSTASSATSMTATPTATSQSSPTTAAQSTKSGVNTGVVAGIAIGVVVILLLGILLTVVLVRRRKHHEQNTEYANASQIGQFQNAPVSSNPSHMTSVAPTSYHGSHPSADFVSHASSSPYSPYSTLRPGALWPPHSTPSTYDYQQSVYQSPATASVATVGHSSRVTSIAMLPNPHPQRTSYYDSSSYRSQPEASSSTAHLVNPPQQPPPEVPLGNNSLPFKVPPSQAPVRLVLHTDVDDPGEPVEEPVEELPPQYSDRRTALPQQPSSGKQTNPEP